MGQERDAHFIDSCGVEKKLGLRVCKRTLVQTPDDKLSATKAALNPMAPRLKSLHFFTIDHELQILSYPFQMARNPAS